MIHQSRGGKKNRLTIIASEEGVEIAEKALIRLGFESKANFAKSQLISRYVVTKFFNHQPIQVDTFKRICDALELNWREIYEREEEQQQKQAKRQDCSSLGIKEEVGTVKKLHRLVTVVDKSNQKIKAEIILKGDINSVNNLKTLELILRQYSGDTIKINDIQEGSIKLKIEGSEEDINRLIERIQSGELTEVNGFPIEDIKILSESSDDEESNKSVDKWRLVQEIVSQRVKNRNLSGVDLSDADLSGANLSGADLSGADLSGADLSRAILSGADLSRADLSGAILSKAILTEAILTEAILIKANLSKVTLNGADLSGANLSRANLREANLSRADLHKSQVTNTKFSSNSLGMTEELKQDLIKRGAIFDDSLEYPTLQTLNSS